MDASTPEQLDKAFLADRSVQLERMNRIVAPLLPFAYISLYPVDPFLDHLIVPLRTLFIVRTCIVLFHFALAAMAFTGVAKRWPDAFAVLCFVTAAVNILILTVLTGGTWSPYDEALMGATFMMAVFIPWRVRYFLPVSMFCSLLYPVMLAASGTLGDTSIWVSHAAVLFVASWISGAATFVLERLRRTAFDGSMQLAKKSEDLERALATIQEQQRNVNGDLAQARNFQHKLIRPLPVDAGIEFAALYEPADFLGGDFYEVTRMGPDWYRLFMVDVTGHGTQAAMRTMVLQQQLERANRSCDTPWTLLSTINESVLTAFGSMVVNYCAMCIDFKKSGDAWVMTGSNAGLPEPALSQRVEVTTITENGAYQGIASEVEYPRFERILAPGDGVVLATDGVVDLLEKAHTPVWIPDQTHFRAALNHSASRALDTLKSHIPHPVVSTDRSDDLTMLVVRIPQNA